MGVLLLPLFKTLSLVLDIYAEKFVEILKKMTEPVYAKIRAKIPPFADFDASPFILLLVLYFIAQMLYVLSNMVL